jgi:ABC-2 type transport system permease protein
VLARLVRVLLRLNAMNELQYRANFFLQLVQSALGLVTGVAGLALVFQHTQLLAGWEPAELLTVLGVYLFFMGFLNAGVTPNLYRLMESVEDGTLDQTLARPVDSQLLVSISQFQIWKLIDVVQGAGVIAFSVYLRGATVGIADAAAFALALLSGAALIYSVWFILACSAFWFVRVWSVMDLLDGISLAGRWPMGIYPSWLQIGLTFLVPVGVAVTVPAQALTGRLTVGGLGLLVGLALASLVAARWIWRRGLRTYSGASA